MNLTQGLTLLKMLPGEVAGIENEKVLANYLSDFALKFAPGYEASRISLPSQPAFWLFLPFATASDFPDCSRSQIRELALAGTYAIIYNILFDTVMDNPDSSDITAQALAESTLGTLYAHLYSLFPAGSPFWDFCHPLYERFLQAMVEEKEAHKGQPQPFTYDDFCRLARGKMSLALLNPVGQAILNSSLERIPVLLKAWEELNVAVVIMDDIKDWEADFRQNNYTYLLAQALHVERTGQQTLDDGDDLISRVVFSGEMEELYRRGAAHLERAAALARSVDAPALAGLAKDRALMFRKFSRQLVLRKLNELSLHLTNQIASQ